MSPLFTFRNFWLFFAFFMANFVGISQNSLAKTTINLALEDSSDFPYVVGNSLELAEPNPGLAIDVLKLVAAKLDVQIKFRRFPWNRCLAEMKQGTFDGCFSASYKKEREKMGVYPKAAGRLDSSRRLMDSSYVFYTKQEQADLWDGETLKHPKDQKLKVVIMRGFSIKSLLEKQQARVFEVDKLTSALAMVQEGRVHGAALIDLPAEHEINKGRFSLASANKPLKTKPYFLMFSHQFYKRHRDLAEGIWNELKAHRNSPQVAALKAKYFDLKQP